MEGGDEKHMGESGVAVAESPGGKQADRVGQRDIPGSGAAADKVV